MLGTADRFLLQLPSLNCLNITFYPPFLAITDNQFRFKPQHGTDMNIFLLKKTVLCYVNRGTASQYLQLS